MEQEPNFQEPHIYGDNLSPEEKDRVQSKIAETRQEALGSVEGEIEKTPRQLQAINELNDYISGEFKRLKLDNPPVLRPEQFHLFPPGDKEHLATVGFGALLQLDKNTSSEDSLLIYAIVHEGLHMSSVYQVAVRSCGGKVSLYAEGLGYHRRNSAMNEKHPHLRGLDEAVVEKMTIEVLHNYGHDDELQEMLKDGKYESAYQNYIDILEAIIEGVAKHNNEDPQETWMRFKRGYFTGKMYHLKDVERTFGPGSLRVLAILGGVKPPWHRSITRNQREIWYENVGIKILEYFTTDDEEAKDKIAKEVLPKSEKQRYRNRRRRS